MQIIILSFYSYFLNILLTSNTYQNFLIKDSLSLNVTEDIFELSNVEINAAELEREENDDKGGNNFCENDRNSEDSVGLG